MDEAITPVELKTSFGSYTVRCTSGKNTLGFERALVLNAAELPVERYAEVRGFFDAMVKAEQTPVVLARE